MEKEDAMVVVVAAADPDGHVGGGTEARGAEFGRRPSRAVSTDAQ